MSANIEIVNGNASLFLADKGAWHGLGTIVNGAQSWGDVIKIAGMNFIVEKRPLYAEHEGNYSVIPYWGIFRTDNQAYLGAVGKSYTPIQNEYAFSFVDTLLGVQDGAHYESAGVLGEGQRVWCLARVPFDFKVDGQDPHQTYLLFTTSHDGSLAATCKLTDVRVVCQNTLTSALSMNGSFTRVKHTKDADRKLEAAKKLMQNAVTSAKDLEDKLTTLSYRKLDQASYTGILDKLFPIPKGKEESNQTRRLNLLENITNLFESNDNDAFPEFRGTAYNLLNAITEYTDHQRGVRMTESRGNMTPDQARRENSIWGTGDALKSEALEVVYEMTTNAATRPYKSYITRAIDQGEADRSNDAPRTSILDLILDN